MTVRSSAERGAVLRDIDQALHHIECEIEKADRMLALVLAAWHMLPNEGATSLATILEMAQDEAGAIPNLYGAQKALNAARDLLAPQAL